MPKRSIYSKLKMILCRAYFVVCLVLLFAVPFNSVLADTFNKQINYQGKLTNSVGIAVIDGDYNLEFKIYTASGANLWTETHTGANRVTVTNGLFSLMLGEITPITSIDWNQTLYLGVNIGGSGLVAIWDGEMTPRKVFGSVSSAFQADKLDNLDSTQFLRADATSTLAVSSVDTALIINQTGAGDLVNFQIDGTSVLSINNSGLASTSALRVSGDATILGTLITTDVTVSDGITLGGEYRTTWPSGSGSSSFWAITTNSLIGYSSLSGDYAVVIGASATTSDDMKFEVVGNSKFGGNLITTGNVGIGTTSPFAKLSVAGDTYLGGNLTATGTLTVAGVSSLQNLTATYASTTALTISGSTYLGSLTGPLQAINGLVSASSTISVAYGGTGLTSYTAGDLIYASDAGTLAGTSTANLKTTLALNNVENTTLSTWAGTTNITTLGTITTGTWNGTTIAVNRGGTGQTSFGQGWLSSDGTTITSSTSPTVVYLTATSTTATTTLAGGLTVAGVSGLTVLQNGSVGINTLTPSQKLDVVGSINIDDASNYMQGGKNILHASSTKANIFVGEDAGRLLKTATIDGDFNTALGYQALYTAVSSQYNTAIGYQSLFSNTTGVNNTANGYLSLYSNTTGVNNTANGMYSLRSNTTGYSNTANGVNALRSNTTGYYNTANGYEALYYNTTGYYNTANGYEALRSNTTGYSNTANGFSALFSNTTGVNNTANGYLSLYSNTTGYSNTANGVNALRSNTTGSYNTANGYLSLYSNTTGVNNTANGYQALRSNTTGVNNTANGMYSLYSNTTGYSNTANGFSALHYNTSASSSVAIGYGSAQGTASYSNQYGTYVGYQAGYSASTGSNNNTMLGYKAGYANTTGANNLLLGYQAGDNITTGSNNIIIGYDVNAPVATDSNQLNIGNTIYGDTSTGNVGIGTTSPYAKLSIMDNNGATLRDVFVISTSTTGAIFKVDSYGQTFADGAYTGTGADYAEYFYTKDTNLASGEVVCLDLTKKNTVKRCTRGEDPNIMGIVSSRPALVGNSKPEYQNNPNYKIVGLLGQLNSKVSTENGAIDIGDSLTSASSTAGYLMKANAGDPTVGVALENLTSGKGEVNVLISRRNQSLTVEQVEAKVSQNIADMKIEDEVQKLITSSAETYDWTNQFETSSSSLRFNVNTQINLSVSEVNAKLETLATKVETNQIFSQSLLASLLASTTELIDGKLKAVKSASTLAETYNSTEDLALGDIVTITSNQAITKATNRAFGVVTEKTTDSYQVTSAGRAEISVSTENGEIKVGDQIKLSSLAGIGMKATTSGQVIGIALNSLADVETTSVALNDEEVEVGKITVSLNLGYARLTPEIKDGEITYSDKDIWTVDITTGQIKSMFGLEMNNQTITNVKALTSASGNWSLGEDGVLMVKSIETEMGVTTKDRATGEYYCMFVENGQSRVVKGKCVDIWNENNNNVVNITTPDSGIIEPAEDILIEDAPAVSVGTSTPVEEDISVVVPVIEETLIIEPVIESTVGEPEQKIDGKQTEIIIPEVVSEEPSVEPSPVESVAPVVVEEGINLDNLSTTVN